MTYTILFTHLTVQKHEFLKNLIKISKISSDWPYSLYSVKKKFDSRTIFLPCSITLKFFEMKIV